MKSPIKTETKQENQNQENTNDNNNSLQDNSQFEESKTANMYNSHKYSSTMNNFKSFGRFNKYDKYGKYSTKNSKYNKYNNYYNSDFSGMYNTKYDNNTIANIASITNFSGFFNKKFNLTIYKKEKDDSRERKKSPERIYYPHKLRGNGIPDDILERIKFLKKHFNDEHFLSYFNKRPKKKESTFEYILNYIIGYSKNHTQLEAVMMAFYYVAKILKYDYHSKKRKTDDKYEQKALKVFERGFALSLGFTNLFEYFLKRLEVKYKHIEGHCKLISKDNWFSFYDNYKDNNNSGNSTIDSNNINSGNNKINNNFVVNHCWNAVFVKGKWYFMDIMLAAGGVREMDRTISSDYPSTEITNDYFNPFYFMTPPHLLINSHLPIEDLWQFTTKTLTPKQFFNSRCLRYGDFYKASFDHNIDFLSHPNTEIRIKSHENLSIKLRVENCVLEGDLVKSNGREKIAEIKYSFEEPVNIFTFEPMFPKPGDYIVRISSRSVTSIDLLYWPMLDYFVRVEEDTKFDHFDKYNKDQGEKARLKAKLKKKEDQLILPKLNRTSNNFMRPKVLLNYDKFNMNKKICYDDENYHIIEPRVHVLRKGANIKFKIRIKATSVSILDGNIWYPLRRTEPDLFEGQKEIDNDDVSLCCTRNRNVYTEVMKFKVHKERSILARSNVIRNRFRKIELDSK